MVRVTRKDGIVIASFPLEKARYCRRRGGKHRRKLESAPLSLHRRSLLSVRTTGRSLLYCHDSEGFMACVRATQPTFRFCHCVAGLGEI
jgi:hypothetical protein